jgi:hypothetical protein
MSVFKSEFSRAVRAHKSDNTDIVNPNTYISTGTNTTATALKLISSTGNFITNSVRTGDIVHNDTDETTATVVSVDSQTQLTLNADIFTVTGKTYTVYGMSPQSGIGNEGCNLYVGGAGNVSVVTIGGDIATFFAVPVGTVLPIQVVRLRATSTTATNVMALF